MMRGNVVHYVTRQYMRRNKKRTLTTFLGIVLMVLLMTCVFVGKDTAIGFLQDLASHQSGKWHVAMYGLTEEECADVEALPYVKEMGRSVNLGAAEFAASGNPDRPYLNVKEYEKVCFDWMNIEVTRGRLPENSGELVISAKALEDGAGIAIGDTVDAAYFERSVTGLGGEVWFPFYEVSVKEGETISVPPEFPYYGETDTFRENQTFTGETGSYEVVGFIEAPSYEMEGSACYTAITLWGGDGAAAPALSTETASLSGNAVAGSQHGGEATSIPPTEADTLPASGAAGSPSGETASSDSPPARACNLSLLLDMEDIPETYYTELQDLAGGREIEFNDYVLVFSGDSTNTTLNLMISLFVIFFVALIIAASMILIYNVFNLSFRERSRYLGMLSSVGATGRQKRSSVYYEAFSLLIPAVPAGIGGGFLVIFLGMRLLKPYLVKFMYGGSHVENVPVKLAVSLEALGMILLVSILTVLMSAFLPARKVGKLGAVAGIRGNTEKKGKTWRMNERRVRLLGAEGLLAANFMQRQPKKAGSIRRAAAVFLVLLMVTSFGADIISSVADKKLKDMGDISIALQGEAGTLFSISSEGSDEEVYRAFVKEIRESEDVDKVSEWETGMFVGSVPGDVYGQEYWDAYYDIFSQFYHHELSEEERSELKDNGYSTFCVAAADDETLQDIAEETGADYEALQDGGAIIISQGVLSTDNTGVYGESPDRYRYFDIGQMSDRNVGDVIPARIYSAKTEQNEELPLKVAGYAANEQLSEYVQFNSQFLWLIVSMDTCEKMMDIMGDEDGRSHFSPELHIRVKGDGGGLLEQLRSLSMNDSGVSFLEQGAYQMMASVADAVDGVIRVLLVCFVALTSVICLMNLYNSICGRMADRRQELAALQSVGMTRKQIEKMLCMECAVILLESLLASMVLSGALIFLIRRVMISLFGYLKMELPMGMFWMAAAFTAAVVVGITLWAFRGVRSENLLEEVRQESV